MLQVLPPPPDMAHWIDGAVIVRLASAAGSHFPAIPHGMLSLRLAQVADRFPARRVLCPPITFHTLSTVPVFHPHAGELAALGLLVRPSAAACLLGHATGAVADQVLGWDTVAGAHEALRVEEAVDRSRTDIECLRALAASFRRTMAIVSRGREAGHARLCDAVGRHGAQAGWHLGLGRRQLERHCREILGVTPKQFQRLTRFHEALSTALTGRPARMADVALEAGYYDQSHFASETRHLAGAPMGALLSAALPDSPWWPLAARRLLGG